MEFIFNFKLLFNYYCKDITHLFYYKKYILDCVTFYLHFIIPDGDKMLTVAVSLFKIDNCVFFKRRPIHKQPIVFNTKNRL